MTNLKKSFSSNQTILLLMPSADYNDVIADTLKSLSKKNVCYVTLNKTYDGLVETFKKKKINIENVIFIDAISKTLRKTPDQGDHVYYVSSPGALTELSLVISKFLRHEFDYLVFDSLTNLLIYQKKAPCSKFLSALINKVKSSKTKAVFYALDVNDQAELIGHAESFVDAVVQTKKTKAKKDSNKKKKSSKK